MPNDRNHAMKTMYYYIHLLLLWLVPTESFFVNHGRDHPPFVVVRSKRTPKSLLLLANRDAAAAEEYLQKCVSEWHQLEEDLNRVKEIQTQESAADLAQAMLEKALDTVAAKKYVELEHESEAMARIQQAVDDEIVAKFESHQAQEEAVAAQEQVDLLESYNGDDPTPASRSGGGYDHDDGSYADQERRRDLAVVHAAHHVERSAAETLRKAHDAANAAIGDLMDAEGAIRSLEDNEKALEVALQELQTLRNEYGLNGWNDEEIDNDYYDNLYWKDTLIS